MGKIIQKFKKSVWFRQKHVVGNNWYIEITESGSGKKKVREKNKKEKKKRIVKEKE